LLAGAVVVLATVVLAVLLLSRGDSEEQPRTVRATLTLEQVSLPGTGGRELVVSLPGPELNTLDVTGGEQRVRLRCLDSAGAVAIDRPVDWPLVEEAGYPPHVHHPAAQPLLDRIRSCRLVGPNMDFEGRAPPPAAAGG
jgi:hypothetical protein